MVGPRPRPLSMRHPQRRRKPNANGTHPTSCWVVSAPRAPHSAGWQWPGPLSPVLWWLAQGLMSPSSLDLACLLDLLPVCDGMEHHRAPAPAPGVAPASAAHPPWGGGAHITRAMVGLQGGLWYSTSSYDSSFWPSSYVVRAKLCSFQTLCSFVLARVLYRQETSNVRTLVG